MQLGSINHLIELLLSLSPFLPPFLSFSLSLCLSLSFSLPLLLPFSLFLSLSLSLFFSFCLSHLYVCKINYIITYKKRVAHFEKWFKMDLITLYYTIPILIWTVFSNILLFLVDFKSIILVCTSVSKNQIKTKYVFGL